MTTPPPPALTFRAVATLGLATALAVLTGCAMQPTGPTATARLAPTAGNSANGTASFTPSGTGTTVKVQVSGLKPNQTHGFHVHEKGDCSAPDATSAGGHFNPTAQPHGPQSAPHHRGDMPALVADANGNASATFMIDAGPAGPGTADLIGKSVIVHAMPDDYTTQPTGNSGARIACGVIGS